ncbi:1-acyl-sn-glycerol-3-phosphate acyltransferase [Rhodococcus sp. IEGM 1379]|uniref:lysophospholipid acyltransferase family protein n=1 Tax=Rhodococcus sp. IEGM 1379 TaxID=3047086 RepID=UPI0024B86A2C|nr:1-acyl-sn-glycerol-3-phosphate acyltransferase [Rhodococcus sp. IEGM 1379]MDI9917246.1 1-acyl-sn-glycerol-3-phosphate acyltransferase [Rhodococcus sp. IEGM 1379]
MDSPEVSLGNYEAVYEYYRAHQQNRWAAKLAYAALALKYRPRIAYAPGAEAALTALLERRTQLVVAVNHLTESDQFTLAATAWRTPLRRMIGRTRVLAKDELFVDPAQRKKVDMMGSIPVFRSKNHGLRAVSDAGRVMMDVAAERLNSGDCLAIFPEGTCNVEDPKTLQHVNSGIGHIVSRAEKLGCSPALVSIGISYGPGIGNVKRASVFVGTPVVDLGGKPMDIARVVQGDLQHAVDGAVASY